MDFSSGHTIGGQWSRSGTWMPEGLRWSYPEPGAVEPGGRKARADHTEMQQTVGCCFVRIRGERHSVQRFNHSFNRWVC